MFNYLKRDNVFKISVIAVLLMIAAVIFKACDRKKINDIQSTTLKAQEKEAVIVDNNHKVTIIKRGEKSTSVQIKRGVRDVRVSLDNNNKLSVILRNKGFILEPGIGFVQTNNARFTIDVQWGFYNQWGAFSGISIAGGDNDKFRIYSGIGYTLPWEYVSNTSIILSYDTKRELGLGIRLKF